MPIIFGVVFDACKAKRMSTGRQGAWLINDFGTEKACQRIPHAFHRLGHGASHIAMVKWSWWILWCAHGDDRQWQHRYDSIALLVCRFFFVRLWKKRAKTVPFDNITDHDDKGWKEVAIALVAYKPSCFVTTIHSLWFLKWKRNELCIMQATNDQSIFAFFRGARTGPLCLWRRRNFIAPRSSFWLFEFMMI